LQQTGKPGLQPENLQQQARQTMYDAKQQGETAVENPQNLDQSANSLINELFVKGGNIAEQVDREAVANVIEARTNKSHGEALQIADNWIATFQQAKAKFQQTKNELTVKAKQTADDVASAISKASIFAFIGLILGAGASCFGGKFGAPNEVVEVKS